MEPEPLVMEGTWEELSAHASEFAGRRLRLVVLPARDDGKPKESDTRSLEEKIAEIAAQVPQELKGPALSCRDASDFLLAMRRIPADVVLTLFFPRAHAAS